MIPNHRPAHFSQRPFDSRGNNWEARPQKIEDTLDRSEIQIDQKVFQLATKENDRGRFLRIVEHNGDRIESIMVSAANPKWRESGGLKILFVPECFLLTFIFKTLLPSSGWIFFRVGFCI